MATRHIGIVGGGIAGLFTAWYILRSKEGTGEDVRISIFDKGEIGHGTSWNAAGMLAPVNELEFQEVELFRAGLRSLELYETDVVPALTDIGFRKEGTVEVGLTADDTAYLKRQYEFQQRQGQAVEWLNGREILEREPFISRHIGPGIWTWSDAQVDNRLLLRALADDLRTRGVELREGVAVTRWEDDPNGRLRLRWADRKGSFDQLLIAPGIPHEAIRNLLPYTIYPVKGEMLSLAPPREPGMGFLKATVRVRSATLGQAYLVPKADRIVCGSTSEEKGHDRQNTAGGLLDILRKCYAAVPGIYELDIRETWAGLRPSTLDRLPVMQKEEGREVYHLNGLYRHGILLGPLLGRGMAEWMVRGNAPSPL